MSTATYAASDHAERHQPAISMDRLQRICLWLMIASGFAVSFEPAPYEILFVVSLVAFMAGGLRVSMVFAPLILFLAAYNIGGFMSVMPILENSKARMFVIISVYMAATSIFFAMGVLRSPQTIMATVRNPWIVAALFASINGIIGYFDVFGLGAQWAPISRAQGLFKDPNVLSTFLIAPAVFLIQDIIITKDRWSIIKLPVLAIVVAALFLAFSRGAWINAVAATIMMIGLHFVLTPSVALKGRILLYTIAGVIAASAMLSIALSFEAVREIFLLRFSLNQSYDVGETGRFGRQLKSLSDLITMPNGLGPLQFSRKYGEDPHNVFLNAFSSYGWTGGISYILLIMSTLLTSWRAIFTNGPLQRHSIAIYAVLITTILQGVQIDTDHWRHFYLLLGLAWGLYAATLVWQSNQQQNT